MENKRCVIKLADIFLEGITGGKNNERLQVFSNKTREIIEDKIKNEGAINFDLDFRKVDVTLSEGLVAIWLLSNPVNQVGGKLTLSHVNRAVIDLIKINGQTSHFKKIRREKGTKEQIYRITISGRR